MHGALAAALRAPWLRDPLWARARMVPALDLRPAETQSLRDWVSGQNLVTFTRASNGTCVTSARTIETLGNDVPRFTFDPVTGRCLGLLVEEARTNLLLNSATLSTQSVSVTATAHTLHFTGTGTVTLSGASTAGPLVGTGTGEANRVSLTFTPSAGTLTLTVSGTVSNAQLEAGSFRTSWIPTTGLAATRAADIATITGANFSSWYRQDEGSFLLVSRVPSDSATGIFPVGVMASDGSFNNIVGLFTRTADDTKRMAVRSGGAAQADFSAGTAYTYGAELRQAGAYRLNDISLSADGSAVATDTSATIPTVNQLGLGTNSVIGGSLQALNGTISRLIFWPRRLPDHILQELTR